MEAKRFESETVRRRIEVVFNKRWKEQYSTLPELIITINEYQYMFFFFLFLKKKSVLIENFTLA
jgi:hypothetical protein